MISDVVIVGITGENLGEGFRLINTESHNTRKNEDTISQIPCLYWTKDKNNKLTKLPKKTYVVIKGHLERDEKHGIYVLVEQLDVPKN